MWDSKLLCLFILSMVDCRLLPVTKPKVTETPAKIVLPQEFLERRQSIMANIKIPNREFCAEMTLQPEDQYRVLPWWYHYCMGLKDKDDMGYKGNVNFNSVHRYILNELQAYKKRQKLKKLRVAEIKKIMASP